MIQAIRIADAGAALEDVAQEPHDDCVVAGHEVPMPIARCSPKPLSGVLNFGLAKAAELWREFGSAR